MLPEAGSECLKRDSDKLKKAHGVKEGKPVGLWYTVRLGRSLTVTWGNLPTSQKQEQESFHTVGSACYEENSTISRLLAKAGFAEYSYSDALTTPLLR
jgi:hypothetical protein